MTAQRTLAQQQQQKLPNGQLANGQMIPNAQLNLLQMGPQRPQPAMTPPTPPASFESAWNPALSPVHGENARKAEYNGLLAGLTLDGMDPAASMPRGEVAQILWNALFLIK